MKLFQASASLPEGGEGSKMEEIVHTIMNNEFDVNLKDAQGNLLLHDAIKVCVYLSTRHVKQEYHYNLGCRRMMLSVQRR